MGIRDRLQRLRAKAEEGGVLIRQRTGGVKVFDVMQVHAEMFLAQMDLLRDTARNSEVLDAVRTATPESRAEFEERFGPIAVTEYIIGSPSSGGWVEAKTLTEDRKVERILYKGGSEEATLVREGLRAGAASDIPDLPRPPGRGPVGVRTDRGPKRITEIEGSGGRAYPGAQHMSSSIIAGPETGGVTPELTASLCTG